MIAFVACTIKSHVVSLTVDTNIATMVIRSPALNVMSLDAESKTLDSRRANDQEIVKDDMNIGNFMLHKKGNPETRNGNKETRQSPRTPTPDHECKCPFLSDNHGRIETKNRVSEI